MPEINGRNVVVSSRESALSSAAAAEGDRLTIRGISSETKARVVRAAHDRGKMSHGAWITEAINEKFDREQSRLPALIVPPPAEVTRLTPSGMEPGLHVEASGMAVDDGHLRVLDAVMRMLSAEGLSTRARTRADDVIVERLAQLRVPRRKKAAQQHAPQA